MPLTLDAAHALFLQQATSRRNASNNHDGDELWATSLAPCRDNGSAGKYFTIYCGSERPREALLRLLGTDLQTGARDSCGNTPCINEMFSHVNRFAPFIDFDLEHPTVDGAWLRRYAEFLLLVLQDCSESPLPASTQVVITTTTTHPLEDFKPFCTDILQCPYCRAEVIAHATNTSVWACRACHASWKFCAATRCYVTLSTSSHTAPAAAHTSTGAGGSGQKRRASAALLAAADPPPIECHEPVRKTSRRVGAHFRVQGVLVTHASALYFLNAVRMRSYAFDPSISVAAWNEALDKGPVQARQLRLTLTDKAAPCTSCKGKRVVFDHDETSTCTLCFGAGFRVDTRKRYSVLDVLYHHRHKLAALAPSSSALPWLSTLRDDGGECDELRRRHREDCTFVVLLCSIATPIAGAEYVDFKAEEDASMPCDVPVHTPAPRKRGRPPAHSARSSAFSPSPSAVAQSTAWHKSQRTAKQHADPATFPFILQAVLAANPRYTGVAVRAAFFVNKERSVLVVHLDGLNSTFCSNKYEQDTRSDAEGDAQGNAEGTLSGSAPASVHPNAGFHRTSRAWVLIKCPVLFMCSLRFRCFNTKFSQDAAGRVCGCAKWTGKTTFVAAATAAQIFPHVNPTEHESSDGTQDSSAPQTFARFSTAFPFLQEFDTKNLARFLSSARSAQGQTAAQCTYFAKPTSLWNSTECVLRFMQANHFAARPPASPPSLSTPLACSKHGTRSLLALSRVRVIHEQCEHALRQFQSKL